MPKNLARDVDLLFEIGAWRNLPRGWSQHLGPNTATIPEHTIRVIWMALIIARYEGKIDEEKLIKMALLHDLPENRTSDHSYVQKVYVTEDEEGALHDTLAGSSQEEMQSIFKEFLKEDSLEAKIVKDADTLDIDLEIAEQVEWGIKVAEHWRKERKRFVPGKLLYTKTAKRLHPLIQKHSPSSWHLKKNKYTEKKIGYSKPPRSK